MTFEGICSERADRKSTKETMGNENSGLREVDRRVDLGRRCRSARVQQDVILETCRIAPPDFIGKVSEQKRRKLLPILWTKKVLVPAYVRRFRVPPATRHARDFPNSAAPRSRAAEMEYRSARFSLSAFNNSNHLHRLPLDIVFALRVLFCLLLCQDGSLVSRR